MRNSIGYELLFADKINLPTNNMESQAKHVQKPINKPTQPQTVPRTDCFDEIAGRFQSGSIESDNSFQIVFSDIPRRRRSSDCESEDSFIVFEDSPDSCYTSNDVFADSDDDNSESDSDANYSGRGIFSIAKKVHNLADNNLYVGSEDEVDCANIEDLKICDSVAASDIGDTIDSKDKISQKKNSPAKQVHFSPNPPKVHVMRVWLYAAKQARCRYWQQFAIDRERFQRRIADVEKELSWVFRTQHRSRVMYLRCVQERKDEAAKNEREAREKFELDKRLKEREVNCQNCTTVGSSKKNENNTKKDESGSLRGKGMLPYSDKKLDTDYVSFPEHVDLNS